MNKNQWNILGVIFIALFFMFLTATSLSDKAVLDRAMMLTPEEGEFIVMNNYFIIAALYHWIGSVFGLIGAGFIICGYLENKDGI